MQSDWSMWLSGLQAASFATIGDTRVRLSRARRLIERAYADPIDLDRLARQACYSRYHFIRRYREQYGRTPHQDLTRARIAAARRLLEETDLPVIEVCFAVGFTSLGSFSTLFKRHVGHSPGRWRRRIHAVPALPAPPIPACFFARFAIVEKSALVRSP